MAEQPLPHINIMHPAPHGERVGLLALCFGIVGAPLAWNLELLAGAALTGHQCFPRYLPRSLPMWTGTWGFLLGMSIAAFALAIAAMLVSWRSWQRAGEVTPGSVHGGEGRVRFMAMSGLMCSALFLVALLFTLGAILLVPLCG